MTDHTEAGTSGSDLFTFLKGSKNAFADKTGKPFTWEQAAAKVREHLADALNARHAAFLLGSGCSSFVENGVQIGIPTMGPLAASFVSTIGNEPTEPYPSQAERGYLESTFGIDIAADEYKKNLEALMEVLISLNFVLRRSTKETLKKEALTAVESVMTKATKFILASCRQGPFAEGNETVVDLYQAFYRKLVFRDRALPRPWVFTTNYDLFNETAMDRLSIPYSNGFSGTVERRFNPANFRYSLGEQLDITSRKWTAADSFVYLCKLHGSVNWVEEDKGLFPIRELQTPSTDMGRVMIYPTPAKQAASFGSPYADLFREFQSRVVREQSVLFVLGYSFGDEHVNNILFQALTIPSFRMIIFAPPEASGVVAKLRALGDPRIWIVGGDIKHLNNKAHYFNVFVEHFMPEPPGDKVNTAVTKALDALLDRAANEQDDENAL